MKKSNQIIFDVSGTLWNDLEQVFLSNYQVLNKEFQINRTPCGNFELTIDWLKQNAAGSCVEMFRKFPQVTSENSDEKLTNLYIKYLKQASREIKCEVYPLVFEMLENLRINNFSLDIISSHPQDILEFDLKETNLFNFFQNVQGNVHYKTDKISNLIKSNLTPYIGDTKSDMLSAKNAGIKGIGVLWGYQNMETIIQGKPHILINSVNDLEQYLLEGIIHI